MKNIVLKTGAAAVSVLALGVGMSPSAVAKDGDVIREGQCSGASDWKLKASPENGRIEVEGEVDSNRIGQSWNWRILHNGRVSASGTATTRGPSGSFEVRRVLVNAAGPDSIGFRATNPRTGESCSGIQRIGVADRTQAALWAERHPPTSRVPIPCSPGIGTLPMGSNPLEVTLSHWKYDGSSSYSVRQQAGMVERRPDQLRPAHRIGSQQAHQLIRRKHQDLAVLELLELLLANQSASSGNRDVLHAYR